MNPNLMRDLIWFGNLVLICTLGCGGFFTYRNAGKEEKVKIPEPPKMASAKKKKESQLRDYGEIWRLRITPPPKIEKPKPRVNVAEQELKGALAVINIAARGVTKENAFATVSTLRGRKKKLVYLGDVFDYEKNTWYHRTQRYPAILHPAVIIDISEYGVTFRYKNQPITLTPQKIGPKPSGPGRKPEKVEDQEGDLWRVSRDEKEEVFNNLESYIKNTGLVAYYNRGRFAGLKIKKLDPNSLPAQRGLKRYDVVTKINGVSISSLAQFKAILEKSREKRRFVIGVLRLGQPRQITFEVY